MEGDERRTVERQLRKKDKFRGIRLDHVKHQQFGGRRTSDESGVEHCGSEEVDGRMNMSKVGGVAS